MRKGMITFHMMLHGEISMNASNDVDGKLCGRLNLFQN